jgi:hypothetical protein
MNSQLNGGTARLLVNQNEGGSQRRWWWWLDGGLLVENQRGWTYRGLMETKRKGKMQGRGGVQGGDRKKRVE